MRWDIAHFYYLTSIFTFDCVISLLIFQGIYSLAADPVNRIGNSQPDLLNVKAQSGWENHV